MKTTTIFALVAIVAAFGMIATTIGTGVLSQQASASEVQFNCHSGKIQSSSGQSFEHSNAFNFAIHC